VADKKDLYPIYREVQYFRQIWLWVLILLVSFTSIYSAVQQIILGKPFGNNPTSDVGLFVIVVIFGFGFPIFFYVMNLTTEVREDGLYFRFFPIHLSFRRIALRDLKQYEARNYSPIREYGGWGIRFGRKGKAYNVSGNRGVQLELSNGARLLIGSQKPEELAEAINRALTGKHFRL
jgi:hypothetical protein